MSAPSPTPRPAGLARLLGLLALVAGVVLALLPGAPAAQASVATADDPLEVNLGLDATPSVSYTRFPANVRTVQDGQQVFSGPVEVGYWTNWQEVRQRQHWLQYTWDEPVRVDRSTIAFWTDAAAGSGDGVAVPESWSIEYWDAGSESWAPVTGASGYPTERGVANSVTFDAVDTTRLRALLDGAPDTGGTRFAGTAVSEWETYGSLAPSDPDAVLEVREVHRRTTPGRVPALPGTVEVVRLDGVTEDLAVTWDDVDPADLVEGAEVAVTGTVDGIEETALATLHVRADPSEELVALEDVTLLTTAGRRPSVPDTVIGTYADDSRSSDVAVSWSTMRRSDYATEGQFELTGTVPGSDLTATAYVFVDAATGGPDTDPAFRLVTDPAEPTGDNGWFTGDVTVEGASVDQAAVALEHTLDAATWTAGESVALSDDGRYDVRFRDPTAPAQVVMLPVLLDATPPTVTASYAEAERELTLAQTDATSGPASLAYRWDGRGAWQTYTAPVSVPATVESVQHRGLDVAGNPATGSTRTPAGPTTSPVNEEAPEVTGRAVVGSTLRATGGSWDRQVELSYAWLRAGTPIAGATGPTYRLRAADVGRRLRVEVTATTADGGSATARSATGDPVVKATPRVTLTQVTSRARVGRPVVLRVRVQAAGAAPTGVVTLTRDGARPVRARLADGEARLRSPPRSPGTQRLVAAYAGDAGTDAGRATRTVRVTR